MAHHGAYDAAATEGQWPPRWAVAVVGRVVVDESIAAVGFEESDAMSAHDPADSDYYRMSR